VERKFAAKFDREKSGQNELFCDWLFDHAGGK